MNTNSTPTFQKLSGKDYCAYWFEAMVKLGLDDSSYAVRFDPKAPAKALEVRKYSHALYDGYGMFQAIGRETGDAFEFLDEAASTRPPLSVWQALRSPKRVSPHAHVKTHPIPWLAPVPKSVMGPDGFIGQIAFEPEIMERIRAHCAAIPCSVYSWVSWAIHQTVQRTLLSKPTPLIWAYMVSMRPWVALDSPDSNHISGLNLALAPDVTPRSVADVVKAAFSANEHWQAWYGSRIGRLVGRWGVLQIYKQVRDMNYTAGHISHSGRVRNRSGQIWALSGIPSPGAPLNFNTQELNNHLAIGLRVDSSFGFSQQAPNTQAILSALKAFVIETLGQAEIAKLRQA